MNFVKEKKGAASLYVVIFATILFGVITLSFIRIILSESSQTSNDDLSQSAYDSALAGVEDAKIAVNQYYQCLSKGSGEKCDQAHQDMLFKQECEEEVSGENVIGLAKYLYANYNNGEVKIQETSNGTDGNSNGTEQAYTCVTISDVTEDYRSTLTSDTRTRVIPIVVNNSSFGNITLANIKKIEFSWYSETNGTVFSNLSNGGKFKEKTESTTPPVISLSVLATKNKININDFNSDSNLNFSTAILLPSDAGSLPDSLQARRQPDGSFTPGDPNDSNDPLRQQNTIDSGGLMYYAQASAGVNNPKLVRCTHSEFACSVTLDLQTSAASNYLYQATGGNPAGGNLMLVVSMPYGDTVTDFMVKLTDINGNVINFDGAQIKVDSTGRANQLVRRVETRLDPADIFFPYPQFALELNGEPSEALRKAFWITANCWTEKGYCNNNGAVPGL